MTTHERVVVPPVAAAVCQVRVAVARVLADAKRERRGEALARLHVDVDVEQLLAHLLVVPGLAQAEHVHAVGELLDLDVAKTPLIVEHEYGPARVQEKSLLAPILEGSISFTRKIDEAAAAMFALQNEVLPSQGIPVQGVGREAFRS